MEKWIHRIASHQADKKGVPSSELEVLQYGYQLMAEKICAFILTVLVAFILGAWREVFLFCIAFIPLRVYAGGYHAGSAVGCMVLSAMIMVIQVYVVRWLSAWNVGIWPIGIEIILFILLLYFSPVEAQNRKIEESERRYFLKTVCFIYVVTIIVEITMLLHGYADVLVSFISAHFTNVVAVFVGKMIQKREKVATGKK